MKTRLLFATATLLAGAVAWSQLRITSFNPNGELTWTNSVYRGFYNVQQSDLPVGPWNTFASVVDLDWKMTNQIRFQAPLTNAPGFYRVAWVPPDPIGQWDYRSYDSTGALVMTGRLNVTSMTLFTSNPPVIYRIYGSWNVGYAGSVTNVNWLPVSQIGTGYLGGTLEYQTSSLKLFWPTNHYSDSLSLDGNLWFNTYTGRWSPWPESVVASTLPFSATKGH